jgi:DNA-binding NtrC family response regulator
MIKFSYFLIIEEGALCRKNKERGSMKKYNSCMLVDDEIDLLETMKMGLESVFEKVDTCRDGREAFDIITSNHYDLIVSDVQMPNMKGDELLRSLRTKGIQTPFICISGNGNHAQMMENKRQGAVDYMDKPFDFDLFILKIQFMIEAHSKKPS